MRERKQNPTEPEEIRVPIGLRVISRRKGAAYRGGNTKRVIVDRGIGGAMRAATYPVEAGLRLAVRVRDGKPTIYPSERVDGQGVVFTAPKIRTMRNGADKSGTRYEQGNGFHDSADPRVSKVGRFLRRHDVDELPQLRLVRRGQMSLVDIRPHTPADEERLEQVLGEEGAEKRRKARSEGRPGVLNLPAVFDRANMRAGDETLGNKWDIWFANNDTFGLDIYVLWKTISMKSRNLYNRAISGKQNKV